jgi:hypothetical protein
LFFGIRENRKRCFVFRCKPSVILRVIGARHKIGDFKILNFLVTVTQRLAFDRSPSGERFWEKCDDNIGFISEV